MVAQLIYRYRTGGFKGQHPSHRQRGCVRNAMPQATSKNSIMSIKHNLMH